MNYEEYVDLINNTSPEDVEKRKKLQAEAGVTTKECGGRGKKRTWYGTLTLVKGEPYYLTCYMWDAPLDVVFEDLSKDLGYEVESKGKGMRGGNGHIGGYVGRKNK